MSSQPIFRLVTASYAGTSVTNPKLGLNSVNTDNIDGAAVTFDKLSTSGRRYDVHTAAVITASSTTLGSGDLNSVLLVSVAGGSRTITLPSTSTGVVVGDWVKICSVSGTTSTNNIIIDPGSGSSIDGKPLGDRLRIDINDAAVVLVYSGSNNWEIIEKVF